VSRDVRAALEAAQARLRVLEVSVSTQADGEQLAAELRREADAVEALLGRVERHALAKEGAGPGARVMAFGFAVLFVLPVVAMVGFSLGGALRREPVAAGALLAFGVVLLAASFSPRAREVLRHRLSADFRLVRDARQLAERLERA
jgi:hypothetical protein